MKIVIDIPADDFNAIRQGGLYFIGHDKLDQRITEAFQSCTIIPKGHGGYVRYGLSAYPVKCLKQ